MSDGKFEKKIIKLVNKCLQGTGLECKLGTDIDRVPKKSVSWGVAHYSLRLEGSQVGLIDLYFEDYPIEKLPADGIKKADHYGITIEKIEVKPFPDAPLTLGEDYRKQLEEDLRTLVKVEFQGTRCRNAFNDG